MVDETALVAHNLERGLPLSPLTQREHERVVIEIERERRRRKRFALPIREFIQSFGLKPPDHLEPILDAMTRAEAGEEVRAVISVPPQHGKSTALLAGLIWLAGRKPYLRSAYATYSQDLSDQQSADAGVLAMQARVSFKHRKPSQRRWVLHDYQGRGEGRIIYTSVGGKMTGSAVDGWMVLDDLVKGRKEAASLAHQKQVREFISGTVMSRLHPGASLFLVGTRWHLMDPIGWVLDEMGEEYEEINLPAITDGEALWPEERPYEWLMRQKRFMLPADWEALYMGQPLPDGAAVFLGHRLYEPSDLRNMGPYREAWGFDSAYTSKTTSDYTVALRCRVYNRDPSTTYVMEEVRGQFTPQEVIAHLKARGVREVSWYLSGTEKGMAALLEQNGIRVDAMPASTDKLDRSVNAAVEWNAGNVPLPAGATWLNSHIAEMNSFTGTGDEVDDRVDALAAAIDKLHGRERFASAEQAAKIYV